MSTKHEQILEYIASLAVGSRISVRGVARELQVSEGTAYRAIKEAEMQGLVSSMDRIGTVRIERPQKKNIERLTFAEVVNIVEGTVLGGRDGLHKTLNKFVIGAMRLEAIARYIDPGSLMIVGNREQVQRLSLEHGAAVLITGGFQASDDIVRLANERELPIISCSYDTFTTATLINRAIYDRLIKKDILFVEDIVGHQELAVLQRGQRVKDYYHLVEETGHARLPVVDDHDRLVGVVTARDIAEADPEDSIELYMAKQPYTVTMKTTVASAAHRMVWEGIEMLPVVQNRKLVGVLSRQDVIKALQLMNRQPQVGETISDNVLRGFEEVVGEDGSLALIGDVTPQMTGSVGTLAPGSLITLIEHSAILCLRRNRSVDMVVENLTLYFLKPVSVDSRIEVRARILDFGRRFAKVDVEAYDGGERAAKALLTTQVLER
ncbi:CBS domain-containing protein [Alicyclobacillus cycloheptanicus]|uniref:Transcriptional regulator n=1 Tax=Alicyclobacillus cycloheptanicus TaxID=1457 RepID=A0ABT9XN35_9BACL|nr:DRTGG domain-containing protein [Alicyclobacillus cycloheptanicus]MDQ0191148.1 putative transcriptional regulator [Alicyclobacillus cycloheptanicus]WDM01889.1 CBS domain-containing protein [Alicyclobacillus cycloheptanicus]